MKIPPAKIAPKGIIPNEVSRRITSLRFLLAVLVVFMHSNATEQLATSASLGSAGIFFTKLLIGISWCAVPLFFLFAAYL